MKYSYIDRLLLMPVGINASDSNKFLRSYGDSEMAIVDVDCAVIDEMLVGTASVKSKRHGVGSAQLIDGDTHIVSHGSVPL